MSIQENIQARREVMELLSLVDSDASPAFWRALAAVAAEHLPAVKEPKSPAKMTRDEVKAFGEKKMHFGQYVGVKIRDIDLDYLLWLTENDFNSQLRRYLASDSIQMEQE